MNEIKPLQSRFGIGFQSVQKQDFPGYREEVHPHFFRYFVTPKSWKWPEDISKITNVIVDGFSPNLNKSLHIGHLRQLALANCLSRVLRGSQWVSLLGTTGILKKSGDELDQWFDFVKFSPTRYYDALMPQDADIVPRHEGEGDKAGALVWDGPRGPVVVFRKADESGYRRATYAFHDLAFAATVKPDHYITGVEQIEHFQNLGLGNKHLPMGLVLNAAGTKMKSRDGGDGMTAREAFDMVKSVMQPVPEPDKIVWNVIAWNMLSTGRSTNIKFDPEAWVKPEAPGMYCSYTWARLESALEGSDQEVDGTYGNESEMNQSDAELAAFSQYSVYYIAKSGETMDPAGLANYLYELCRAATKAYHSERIREGRPGFRFAVSQCKLAIEECMEALGMFFVLMR
jgi:arginyl-tRNA synthetase